MIKPQELYDYFVDKGVSFFTGVPDSLLKDFCAYVTDHASAENHIIASNEGGAIALASGYHLATGDTPIVYLQNSGLGNCVNPLLSLADVEVYQLPLLMVIGWRGEPGVKDEPQHVKQGRVMEAMLDSMEIPHETLPESLDEAQGVVDSLLESIEKTKKPHALLVRKGTFEAYKLKNQVKTNYEMNREDAVKVIIDHLAPSDIVVSTTGKTSREVFEYREELSQGHSKDFLTVGAMGHANQIALGIALEKKDRKVYCFDGDGAAIMHMGSLGIIGSIKPSNYIHIVINNGAHDSVGGQPTIGFDTDFIKISESLGYVQGFSVSTAADLSDMLKKMNELEGPLFLEVRVNKGARADLGRPTTTPTENKSSFMKFLAND